MSEVLKSKTVADKFFKELLQKIKGSKVIAFSCPINYAVSEDKIWFAPWDFDTLAIYFDNQKVLYIGGNYHEEIVATYEDINEKEKKIFPNFYDFTNDFHKSYMEAEDILIRTFKFSANHSDIIDIKTHKVSKKYKVYENSEWVTKNDWDVFDRIDFIFSNGNVFSIDIPNSDNGDLNFRLEGMVCETKEITNYNYVKDIKTVLEYCNHKRINKEKLTSLLDNVDVNQIIERRREPLVYSCIKKQTLNNAIKIYDAFIHADDSFLDEACGEYCLDHISKLYENKDVSKLVEKILSGMVITRNNIWLPDFHKLKIIWEDRLEQVLKDKQKYSPKYIKEIKKVIEIFKENEKYNRK